MFVARAGPRAGSLAPMTTHRDPQLAFADPTNATLAAAQGRASALWASAKGHKGTARDPQSVVLSPAHVLLRADELRVTTSPPRMSRSSAAPGSAVGRTGSVKRMSA